MYFQLYLVHPFTGVVSPVAPARSGMREAVADRRKFRASSSNSYVSDFTYIKCFESACNN